DTWVKRPRIVCEFGGRLTSDPNRSSLGLLPSGPDPVGEWLVHRQPPGLYIGRHGPKGKDGPVCYPAPPSDPRASGQPQSIVVLELPTISRSGGDRYASTVGSFLRPIIWHRGSARVRLRRHVDRADRRSRDRLGGRQSLSIVRRAGRFRRAGHGL